MRKPGKRGTGSLQTAVSAESTETQEDEMEAVSSVSEDNSAHSPSVPHRGRRLLPGSFQLSQKRRKNGS